MGRIHYYTVKQQSAKPFINGWGPTDVCRNLGSKISGPLFKHNDLHRRGSEKHGKATWKVRSDIVLNRNPRVLRDIAGT